MKAPMLDAHSHPDRKSAVLTKALLNMAKYYHLKGKDLSDIIGMSESSTTRLHQGTKVIYSDSKEGEIALLLLRLYRSLNTLVGNDNEKARMWLNASNHYFAEKPIDHIKKIQGLIEVVNYLDAMRGKI